jgi:hypothetical protein
LFFVARSIELSSIGSASGRPEEFLKKIAQNFVEMNTFIFPLKKLPNYWVYFSNFQKSALKVNTCPTGGNSANLVTLFSLLAQAAQFKSVILDFGLFVKCVP